MSKTITIFYVKTKYQIIVNNRLCARLMFRSKLCSLCIWPLYHKNVHVAVVKTYYTILSAKIVTKHRGLLFF